MTETSPGSRRPSLRQLLVFIVLLAVAWAALKFASPLLAGMVTTVALLVCGVMAVYAFVDRGRRQAFAIGFTVVAVGFTYAVHTYDDENNLRALPTTQLLQWLHGQMAAEWMVDPSTGERVRRRHPPEPEAASIYYGGSSPPLPDFMSDSSTTSPYTRPFGARQGNVVARYFPGIQEFVAVGNSLWALLLAYLGGKFAVWVYARRIERESGSSVPASGDT